MSAIVVALKAVAIDRLEETKRGVSKDIHKELQETSALLDHNNRAYQKMLENYRGPVIPILRERSTCQRVSIFQLSSTLCRRPSSEHQVQLLQHGEIH